MKTVNEVIQYFENLYNSGAIYLWAANSQIITKELCDYLYKHYGNKDYDKTYYDKKFLEGAGKIGADCSGSLYPLSGVDQTAQGYYNSCLVKGGISLIDRNKPCLVFKGKSVTSIYHVGFYCGNGYTIEMESSDTNCVKKTLDKGRWNYFGIPSWIDYTGTTTTQGVDLSSNQGAVDFAALKRGGYQFVILRTILKSGNVDTYFKQYLSEAKKNGLKIGVYIFSYDTTEMQAITSAQRVINLLNGEKYPIFLDLEWANQRALGNATVTKIAQAFMQTCTQYGYKSYIYCNLDWYNKNVIQDAIKPYAIWIARYGGKPNVGEKIWQYSSKGNIDGIKGNVDLNYCYDMSIFDGGASAPSKPTQQITVTPMNILGVITASTLRIRQEPNTESDILGNYNKGEIVSLIGKTSNDWYKTDKGYISGEYVKYLQGKVVNCNKVNVRQLPTTTSPSLKVIPAGTTVYVIIGMNDWYNVLLSDNTVGWIKNTYLKLLL